MYTYVKRAEKAPDSYTTSDFELDCFARVGEIMEVE